MIFGDRVVDDSAHGRIGVLALLRLPEESRVAALLDHNVAQFGTTTNQEEKQCQMNEEH